MKSNAAQADRSQPWLWRPFIIRHIPFGLSVKLRQFDGGVSVELEYDLITATISIWIYWECIHNACLTWYQCAPIRVCAPIVVTELRSWVPLQMCSKALCEVLESRAVTQDCIILVQVIMSKVMRNAHQHVNPPTLKPAHPKDTEIIKTLKTESGDNTPCCHNRAIERKLVDLVNQYQNSWQTFASSSCLNVRICFALCHLWQ